MLVLPLIILELINQRPTWQDARGVLVLFGVLWLLPTAFVLLLMPMVRDLRAKRSLLSHPLRLVLRIVPMGLIAMFWITLVIDQLPCFLGVPNCD